MRRWALLFLISFTAACTNPRAPGSEPFLDIGEAVPNVIINIRYATEDNFTGKILYPENRCVLRRSAARSLALVQQDLETIGLGLKVWDCYRPLHIQHKLWALVPDPRYVADPEKGSRHNRGAAVDITLVDKRGQELEMPTGYDDFSIRAHWDSQEASALAIKNRGILRDAMMAHGFTPLKTEWWHFDAPRWRHHALSDATFEQTLE
ncbi:MAG: peptidase M15 [Elusimicrobia bacterium]|nr:MAG: peptidase M15 [Elusimicrobiota bacterium]